MEIILQTIQQKAKEKEIASHLDKISLFERTKEELKEEMVPKKIQQQIAEWEKGNKKKEGEIEGLLRVYSPFIEQRTMDIVGEIPEEKELVVSFERDNVQIKGIFDMDENSVKVMLSKMDKRQQKLYPPLLVATVTEESKEKLLDFAMKVVADDEINELFGSSTCLFNLLSDIAMEKNKED